MPSRFPFLDLSIPGFVSPRFLGSGFCPITVPPNPCFTFPHFLVLGLSVLGFSNQGFAALLFFRFARTTVTAMPETRTAPPIIESIKTGKLPLPFSGFAESRFCVSTFPRSRFCGLAFAVSWFCVPTFSRFWVLSDHGSAESWFSGFATSWFCVSTLSRSRFAGLAFTESGFYVFAVCCSYILPLV